MMRSFSIVLTLVLMGAFSAQAQVPERLQYQGYLQTVAGDPVDCPTGIDCEGGPYTMTMRLYDGPVGGVPIWEEEHGNVAISKGIFTVTLGATEPLIPTELPGALWLGIVINGGPEASPRQQVVSSAFALRASEAGIAQDADALGGLPADNYATKDELPGLCVTPEALTEALEAQDAVTPAQVEVVLVDGGYVKIGDLANIAFTGSYLDLQDVPGVLGQLGVNDAGDLTFNGVPVMNNAGEWVGAETGLQGPKGDSGTDGVSVVSAEVNDSNELVVTLSDGTVYTSGSLKGAQGAQGIPGIAGLDGQDGQDGQDGAQGLPGIAGLDGQDGVSVTSAEVNSAGELVMVLSDGTITTSQSLVGPAGADGTSGTNGTDGLPGIGGLDGAPGLDALVDVLNEAPGGNCSNGGVLIRAGQDLNEDGILQSTEVTSGQYICNGADGADGANGSGGSSGGGNTSSGNNNYGLPPFAGSPPQDCDVSILEGTYFDTNLGNYRTCNGQIWVPQSDSCGDGVTDPGEMCDDANLFISDGCALCATVSPLLCDNTCTEGSTVVGNNMVKITADDGAYYDEFGYDIDLDGDTVVIGARLEDDASNDGGAAYVFVRDGDSWALEQKLVANDGGGYDEAGFSVAISGDTLAVGVRNDDDKGTDSGSVYVYTRTGTTWTLEDKITTNDVNSYDYFGVDVDLDGDTLAIGAEKNDGQISNVGAVYVYTREAGTWSLEQKLYASDPGTNDHFGHSISLSGDDLAVGAYLNDEKGNNSGSAYIFTRTGTTWTEQQAFIATDGASDDWFGWDVSISGELLAIGAYYDDDKGGNSGATYVYTRSNDTWSLEKKLTAFDGASDDWYGHRVALSGETLVVGAYYDDDRGNDSGSAYVYNRDAGNWTLEQKLTPSDGTGSDYFGFAIALSGDDLIVSSYWDDDKGSNSGSVYEVIRGALCADDGSCVCQYGYGGSDCGSALIAP